jgi:hypothetical protein
VQEGEERREEGWLPGEPLPLPLAPPQWPTGWAGRISAGGRRPQLATRGKSKQKKKGNKQQLGRVQRCDGGGVGRLPSGANSACSRWSSPPDACFPPPGTPSDTIRDTVSMALCNSPFATFHTLYDLGSGLQCGPSGIHAPQRRQPGNRNTINCDSRQQNMQKHDN